MRIALVGCCLLVCGALLTTGAVLSACAGPQAEAAEEKVPSDAPFGPNGRCMWDRRTSYVRHCVHFSFGRCQEFGDQCTKEQQAAQKEQDQEREAAGK